MMRAEFVISLNCEMKHAVSTPHFKILQSWLTAREVTRRAPSASSVGPRRASPRQGRESAQCGAARKQRAKGNHK